MPEQADYQALMTDIIAKQAAILGPDIAMLKARSVSSLTLDEEGRVVGISGDPQTAMEQLIDEYVRLSGQIVKTTLSSVFSKYPAISKDGEKAGSQ